MRYGTLTRSPPGFIVNIQNTHCVFSFGSQAEDTISTRFGKEKARTVPGLGFVMARTAGLILPTPL